MITLKRDETMTNEEFKALKRKADKFMVFRRTFVQERKKECSSKESYL